MSNQCINTAMIQCFWCGEASGIAIGQKLVSCDKKWKTNYIFGGYEPCDKCKENREKGFTVVQAQDKPVNEGQPEIQDGIYPTGVWIVVKNESLVELLGQETVDLGMCFMDKEMMEKIGLIR